jgi:hypothetical protein
VGVYSQAAERFEFCQVRGSALWSVTFHSFVRSNEKGVKKRESSNGAESKDQESQDSVPVRSRLSHNACTRQRWKHYL